MPIFFRIIFALLLTSSSTFHYAYAQNINVLPKYGNLPKNEKQLEADKEFITAIDQASNHNRKRAAEEIAMAGWKFLRLGNRDDAMRRFNQAWLLDNANATALWGMAVTQMHKKEFSQALKLFSEAEYFINDSINFSADYAKAISLEAAQTNDQALQQKALTKFAQVYEKNPQHLFNLQSWAISLYLIEDYTKAWSKIQIAETLPDRANLDQNFLSALQEKMPRPKDQK